MLWPYHKLCSPGAARPTRGPLRAYQFRCVIFWRIAPVLCSVDFRTPRNRAHPSANGPSQRCGRSQRHMLFFSTRTRRGIEAAICCRPRRALCVRTAPCARVHAEVVPLQISARFSRALPTSWAYTNVSMLYYCDATSSTCDNCIFKLGARRSSTTCLVVRVCVLRMYLPAR